jgi:nucleolar pre-ribosomal-associated protein 1
LAIAILAALLTLLSQHFIYQSDGDPIIQQLVSSMYMRRLNAHLGGAQHDLILMTLKLFNAMVGFADGREKRAIMDGFAWGMKVRVIEHTFVTRR